MDIYKLCFTHSFSWGLGSIHIFIAVYFKTLRKVSVQLDDGTMTNLPINYVSCKFRSLALKSASAPHVVLPLNNVYQLERRNTELSALSVDLYTIKIQKW